VANLLQINAAEESSPPWLNPYSRRLFQRVDDEHTLQLLCHILGHSGKFDSSLMGASSAEYGTSAAFVRICKVKPG
jgi:hypothetical protein